MEYKIIAKNRVLLQQFIDAARLEAASVFNVDKAFFKQRDRKREKVDAKRSLVANMHLIFNSLLTLERYGMVVGRDHSTAIHYIKTAEMLDGVFQEKHRLLGVRLRSLAMILIKSGDVLLEVSLHLDKNHPNILYLADHNLNESDQGKKRSFVYMRNPRQGYPSLIIFEPRKRYNACMIELSSLMDPTKTVEYAATHALLANRGFYAIVARNTRDCINLIENYLDEKID